MQRTTWVRVPLQLGQEMSSLHRGMAVGAGNVLGMEGEALFQGAGALSNVNNHGTMRWFKIQISEAPSAAAPPTDEH